MRSTTGLKIFHTEEVQLTQLDDARSNLKVQIDSTYSSQRFFLLYGTESMYVRYKNKPLGKIKETHVQ